MVPDSTAFSIFSVGMPALEKKNKRIIKENLTFFWVFFEQFSPTARPALFYSN
jgi:hypothetical protein